MQDVRPLLLKKIYIIIILYGFSVFFFLILFNVFM